MIDTASERGDPQRVKRTEKSGPNAGKEGRAYSWRKSNHHCGTEQQQATSTKQADGVTHAQRCAPGQERDQVPHSRSARGVDNLIFNARGNTLTNEPSRRDYTAQTCGDSTDAALEKQLRHTSRCETTDADGPDSAWMPSSCSSSTRPSNSLSRHRDRCRPFRGSRRLLRYRRYSSWRRTHDAETVPLIQKIRKTFEVPQAKPTDMPVVTHDKRLGFRSAADRGAPTGPAH